MRQNAWRLLLSVFWLATIAASFYFGARIGVREHWLVMSQYEAAADVGSLKMMDRGQCNDLRSITEINLDTDLARYGDYLDSRWKWLWPELEPSDMHLIKFAATYRATHPFAEPDVAAETSDENPEFKRQVVSNSLENKRQLARVIKAYAATP